MESPIFSHVYLLFIQSQVACLNDKHAVTTAAAHSHWNFEHLPFISNVLFFIELTLFVWLIVIMDKRKNDKSGSNLIFLYLAMVIYKFNAIRKKIPISFDMAGTYLHPDAWCTIKYIYYSSLNCSLNCFGIYILTWMNRGISQWTLNKDWTEFHLIHAALNDKLTDQQ